QCIALRDQKGMPPFSAVPVGCVSGESFADTPTTFTLRTRSAARTLVFLHAGASVRAGYIQCSSSTGGGRGATSSRSEVSDLTSTDSTRAAKPADRKSVV